MYIIMTSIVTEHNLPLGFSGSSGSRLPLCLYVEGFSAVQRKQNTGNSQQPLLSQT